MQFSILFGPHMPADHLIRDLLHVVRSEECWEVDHLLAKARSEAEQVRSMIINRKGLIFARRKEEKLSKEDIARKKLQVEAIEWTREDLQKLQECVDKEVKNYLLTDFVEPRSHIPGSFPSLWALTALVYVPQKVTAFDGKAVWVATRNKIRSCVDRHFGLTGMTEQAQEKIFDDERNVDLIGSCLESVQRVVMSFEEELLATSLEESFEKHVGEWLVLSHSRIVAFSQIEELEPLVETMRGWSMKLFSQAVGDVSNLSRSSFDFPEVLACRWAIQKLGKKVPKEVDKVLATTAREQLVVRRETSDDYASTLQLVWSMMAKDLGFHCGKNPGELSLREALKHFEDTCEDRFSDLTWDMSYNVCKQSAANVDLWILVDPLRIGQVEIHADLC
jgi:hypothetical protein